MRYEGNPAVLSNLLVKKRLLNEGNDQHKNIRPALLVLSGLMRGVSGGGQVTALQEFGLQNIFDAAYGISTGAPAVGYLLAGQAALGTTIYSDECTRPDFLSLKRLRRGPIMDTGYISRVFRGETGKRLDEAAIRKSRTKFYVGVTCAEQGDGCFIDAKAVTPDMVQALHASVHAPGITKGAVSVDSRKWVDGGVGLTFPSQEVIEHANPTDLLILANHSGDRKKSISEGVFEKVFLRNYSDGVRKAFADRHRAYAQGLEYLNTKVKCRWGIIWSSPISRFERNVDTLKQGSLVAKEHLTDLLKKAQDSL